MAGRNPVAVAQSRDQIQDITSRYSWWHTIDLPHSLVTPGAWDIRHLPPQIPWPESLSGKRCLDVGTMDGFWAFEMERRSASEILAIDVPYSESDVPYSQRQARSQRSHRQPGETFNALANLLGSKAMFQTLNIYDLKPESVGEFDLVFVGYMLHQLRDPGRALEAVRSVCRGSIILLEQIMFYRSLLSREPLARFAGRPGSDEWFYFNAAGLQRIVERAGFHVAAVSPFLYYRRGPAVKLSDLSLSTLVRYSIGRAACSLAVRGDMID